MSITKRIAGALSALLLTIGGTGAAQASPLGYLKEAIGWPNFPPVENEPYRDSCGSCHLAYPPSLLSADVWRDLMGRLKTHFGDDAALEPAESKEVLDYLVAHAAQARLSEHTPFGWSAAHPAKDPPRITETYFFRKRHKELAIKDVQSNPKIKSFANCQACHPKADQGHFSDLEVAVPKSVPSAAPTGSHN
jgi:hypothetical protein